MNKKIILTLILSSSLVLMAGCSDSSQDTSEETDITSPVENENDEVIEIGTGEAGESETDADLEENDEKDDSEKSSSQVMEEFEAVKESDIVDILNFIEDNITYVNTEDADTMISTFIEMSTDEVNKSNEYLFSLNSSDINDTINRSAKFDKSYSIFGEKRDELLLNIDDEEISKLLMGIFEKGQGLISAEGSYYATLDYLYLYNMFGNNVSKTLKNYLEIASIETVEPSTIEEYLAISIDELKNRSIRYEDFLIHSGESKYAGEVRLLYLTALWKVVHPSLFDDLLNQDFTVKEEMLKFYGDTKDLDQYPVLQAASRGVLEFVDSREGGVLGSLDDNEEFTEYSRVLLEEAANKIDREYMSN